MTRCATCHVEFNTLSARDFDIQSSIAKFVLIEWGAAPHREALFTARDECRDISGGRPVSFFAHTASPPRSLLGCSRPIRRRSLVALAAVGGLA